MKNRVTGIGGIFFKSSDPEATKTWYKKHLGFNTDQWGCTFWWYDKDGNKCSTQWVRLTRTQNISIPQKRNSCSITV